MCTGHIANAQGIFVPARLKLNATYRNVAGEVIEIIEGFLHYVCEVVCAYWRFCHGTASRHSHTLGVRVRYADGV
jgi:hypothetical protein